MTEGKKYEILHRCQTKGVTHDRTLHNNHRGRISDWAGIYLIGSLFTLLIVDGFLQLVGLLRRPPDQQHGTRMLLCLMMCITLIGTYIAEQIQLPYEYVKHASVFVPTMGFLTTLYYLSIVWTNFKAREQLLAELRTQNMPGADPREWEKDPMRTWERIQRGHDFATPPKKVHKDIEIYPAPTLKERLSGEGLIFREVGRVAVEWPPQL